MVEDLCEHLWLSYGFAWAAIQRCVPYTSLFHSTRWILRDIFSNFLCWEHSNNWLLLTLSYSSLFSVVVTACTFLSNSSHMESHSSFCFWWLWIAKPPLWFPLSFWFLWDQFLPSFLEYGAVLLPESVCPRAPRPLRCAIVFAPVLPNKQYFVPGQPLYSSYIGRPFWFQAGKNGTSNHSHWFITGHHGIEQRTVPKRKPHTVPPINPLQNSPVCCFCSPAPEFIWQLIYIQSLSAQLHPLANREGLPIQRLQTSRLIKDPRIPATWPSLRQCTLNTINRPVSPDQAATQSSLKRNGWAKHPSQSPSKCMICSYALWDSLGEVRDGGATWLGKGKGIFRVSSTSNKKGAVSVLSSSNKHMFCSYWACAKVTIPGNLPLSANKEIARSHNESVD